MSDDWIDPDIVAHKGWDTGLLRRLLAFTRPHASQFAKSIGVLSGVYVCALLGPWIWKCAIDGPLAGARLAPVVLHEMPRATYAALFP